MTAPNRRRAPWIPTALAAAALASPLLADTRLERRITQSTEVYRELLQGADRRVPAALLRKCRCVAVLPRVIKGAIGYGARHGHGVISCRGAGGWSPISFLTLTGGSVGFQLGAESSDFVLFLMTDHGARSLIGSNFTLGGKVSVAAGPAGRSAEAATDIKLDAEVYSYAKSKGLFAGISLEGARLAPDTKANREYYGAPVSAEALLFGHRAPKNPPEARAFRGALR